MEKKQQTYNSQNISSRGAEYFDYCNEQTNPFEDDSNRREKLINCRKNQIEEGLLSSLDMYVVDRNNYKIISKQLDADGDPVSMDMIASRYLKNTAEMIHQLDGSVGDKTDTAIYLDKSARPLEALTKKFWKNFSKPGSQRPKSKFLNIDRNDIFSAIGVPISRGYIDNEKGMRNKLANTADFINNFQQLSESDKTEILARIRANFISDDAEVNFNQDDIFTEIMNTPVSVADETLTVIDETGFSGATLGTSIYLLEQALPEVKKINGIYFWDSETSTKKNLDGKRQHGTVPVWYDDEDAFGRGISDRNDSYFEYRYHQNPTQKNFLRKIGSLVLSTPHYDYENKKYLKDDKFKNLMLDFDQLKRDFEASRVLLEPTILADDEWREKILESQGFQKKKIFFEQNGITFEDEDYPDFNELIQKRKANSKKLGEIDMFEKLT